MSYNPTDFFKKKKENVGEVKIEFDPNVITRKSERKAMSTKEIAEYSREAVRGTSLGSSQANMGLSSSMGKSDRQTALIAGIKKGKFKSVAQIAMALNVKEPTVKRYLKELNIDFDLKTGRLKAN